MPLIKSISGIRGTIGEKEGEDLTPNDISRFTIAYGVWLLKNGGEKGSRIVIGRDARPSGEMVSGIVAGTLVRMGFNVVDLGLASTPTVELAVVLEKAAGGIIITASHNPSEWNALKLLNNLGEFISASDGNALLAIAGSLDDNDFKSDFKGSVTSDLNYSRRHIEMVLALPDVNRAAVAGADLKVAVDCINSVGGIVLPDLLNSLGVTDIVELNCYPDGNFAHNPEPLPEHLGELARLVVSSGADVGLVVDPDVDRLAIVCEDGSFFNEEYTLVACADYILSRKKGNTVSNFSSTRALRDITGVYGGKWYGSPVGEVNVVEKMKEVDAVIGGEGNGGVIYPQLHYGRDAIVGAALFLSHLATAGMKCSELRYKYPGYVISKNRIELPDSADPVSLLNKLRDKLGDKITDSSDGLLIETGTGWVQVRKSNTEPILRVYSEGPSEEAAGSLADEVIKIVKSLL